MLSGLAQTPPEQPQQVLQVLLTRLHLQNKGDFFQQQAFRQKLFAPGGETLSQFPMFCPLRAATEGGSHSQRACKRYDHVQGIPLRVIAGSNVTAYFFQFGLCLPPLGTKGKSPSLSGEVNLLAGSWVSGLP